MTPGDGLIIFEGMQDSTAESIKSLEGFDVAWVEEAQTLSARSLSLLRPHDPKGRVGTVGQLEPTLDTLDDADMTLLFFALATLKGRAFQLSVPAPERYAELREFAEHIGATFEEVEGGQAIFRPPAAQERRASRARRRLTSRVKSKSKSRLGSPLGIGLARPVHPRIWKRIHIQKPSGVHTKIFLAGRRTPFPP